MNYSSSYISRIFKRYTGETLVQYMTQKRVLYAKQLMALLQQQGQEVRQAAQAAAAGEPGQLMAVMERLMRTREGAELVERIENQARQAGLE